MCDPLDLQCSVKGNALTLPTGHRALRTAQLFCQFFLASKMVNRVLTPHNVNLSELRFGVKGNYRPSDSVYPQTGSMKDVGTRIKDLRTERQLTQPQLAQATKIAQSTLSELEAGLSKHPSSLSLVKLAKFFEVEIEWLLTGKGERQQVSSMRPDEAELLLLYRALSEPGRSYMLARVRDLHQTEHRHLPDAPPEASPPSGQPKRRH